MQTWKRVHIRRVKLVDDADTGNCVHGIDLADHCHKCWLSCPYMDMTGMTITSIEQGEKNVTPDAASVDASS